MGSFGTEATEGNSLHRPCGMTTWVGVITPPSQPTPPKAVTLRRAFDDEEAKDAVLVEDEFEFANAWEIRIGDIMSKCRVFQILTSAVGK